MVYVYRGRNSRRLAVVYDEAALRIDTAEPHHQARNAFEVFAVIRQAV